MAATQTSHASSQYEVRFEPLVGAGRTMNFPCDEAGRVDLDTLTERGRNNYFYARAMLGRQYAPGRIVPAIGPHRTNGGARWA